MSNQGHEKPQFPPVFLKEAGASQKITDFIVISARRNFWRSELESIQKVLHRPSSRATGQRLDRENPGRRA
jgi:hypothetical protein